MAISFWLFYHPICKSNQNNSRLHPYRARFQPKELITCLYSKSDLKTRTYILTQCSRSTETQVALFSLCSGNLIKFLIFNSTTFAFTQPREPPQLPKLVKTYSLLCLLSQKININIQSSIYAYALPTILSLALYYLFSHIFFSASVLFCFYFILFVYLLEALGLCSQQTTADFVLKIID